MQDGPHIYEGLEMKHTDKTPAGIMQGKPDLLNNTPTLALYRDETAKLRARLEAYEAALREIERLGSLVAHDLQGRVEGGKLAAVARLSETARKALEEK